MNAAPEFLEVNPDEVYGCAPEGNDGGYVATVPALPGCVSQGDSREEALRNIGEAIELYIEDVKAAGESIPSEDGREYVEVTASV